MCVYSSLVTEQRVLPDVQPTKEFSPKEQNLQQGITVETETWKQGKVLESLPGVREVEDDWYVLLDVASKKSGRSWSLYFTYTYNFNMLFITCYVLQCDMTAFSPK